MTDKQLRGHCPHCGAEQAIINGRMAHHGYTVEHGYFNGTCSASRKWRPIEVEPSTAEDHIGWLERFAHNRKADLDELMSGMYHPNEVVLTRGDRWNRRVDRIKWADATPQQRAICINQLARERRQQIQSAEGLIKILRKAIERYAGQPLIEAERRAKPAPIRYGERRTSKTGVILTAGLVERGRVNYTFDRGEKTMRGWMGVQSWRDLEKAPN